MNMNNEKRHIRILFVDDSDYVLQSLERMLWSLKDICDLAFANAGAQALALHRKHHFDVIVSDLEMPIMNGWELLHAAQSAYRGLRCFILSGDPAPAFVAKASERGYGLIEKPCSAASLQAAIFGGKDEGHDSSPRQEGEGS